MLIVHPPEIVDLPGGQVKLKAVCELQDDARELWFSTGPEYADWLCRERADAFVLPALFYAMKRGLPLRFAAPISEKLFYGVNTYLQKALVDTLGDMSEVPVTCTTASNIIRVADGVATGLSCGVDSLSTVATHLSGVNKLTYLTFFNVGGHNPLHADEATAQALFSKRVGLVKACAEDLGLPLVIVDSNVDTFFHGPYSSYVTFAIGSAVLALQKLFKTYLVSSSARFDEINFNRTWCGDYDIFSLPLISTEGLTFYSSGSSLSRVEKTKLLTTFPPSYKHLNVCLFEDRNCSVCEKCLRTQLSLEMLGALHLYKGVFDIDAYRANRTWYLGYLLSNMHPKGALRAIYSQMKASGQSGPYSEWEARAAWYLHRAKNRLARLGGHGESLPKF